MILRWAKPNDHKAIMDLLKEMHLEIGVFSFSEAKTSVHVSDVLENGKVLLAEIDGGPVGSVGLVGSCLWYSEDKIITDDWIFVSAKTSKRLHVFKSMIAAIKSYALEIRAPLVLTLFSKKDAPKKAKLFERYGDKIMRGFQFTDVGGEYRVQ